MQSNYKSSLIERNHTRSRSINRIVQPSFNTWTSSACIGIDHLLKQNVSSHSKYSQTEYTMCCIVQKYCTPHKNNNINIDTTSSYNSGCNNKNASFLGVAISNDLCTECACIATSTISLCVYDCAVYTWISLLCCVPKLATLSLSLFLFHLFACPYWLEGSHLHSILQSAHSSYIALAFSCYALSNDSQPKVYLESTAQDAHSQNLHQIMNNMDARYTHTIH